MAPARERERTSALSVSRAAVPIYTYRARRRGILFLTTTTTTTANFSPRIGWRRALWSLSSLYASGDYRVDSVRRHDGPLAPVSPDARICRLFLPFPPFRRADEPTRRRISVRKRADLYPNFAPFLIFPIPPPAGHRVPSWIHQSNDSQRYRRIDDLMMTFVDPQS